jgi:hypothetical protein
LVSSLEYEDFEIEEEIVTNENEDPEDRTDILKKIEILEETSAKSQTPTKPFVKEESLKSPQKALDDKSLNRFQK